MKPNADAGQEEERDVEGLRALVQAFEDGASEGVKEGKGKRKGECHFLASVFANISIVRPILLRCSLSSTQSNCIDSGNTTSTAHTPTTFPSPILVCPVR